MHLSGSCKKAGQVLKNLKVKKIISIIILVVIVLDLPGQFAPAAGEPGSTAIFKDDNSFTGWAKSCKVTRGFINIADTNKTFTQNPITSNRAFFGTEALATGKPGGALDCISLGDGGVAVLTFDFPIRNGAGADFAVFENGIKEQEPPFQYFLELAFVEVSTDGKKYVRFPAVSNTPALEQLNSFGQINPVNIHNLAGKYIANYGTPFDLQDIRDSAGINLDSINFVRLIDVVGNINPKYASYDSKKQIINDPFPTEFWSGGFDLDAVGVIHMNGITAISKPEQVSSFRIYPNPILNGNTLYVESDHSLEIELWSTTGYKLKEWKTGQKDLSTLSLPPITTGLYLLSVRSNNAYQTIKLLVK